MKKVFVNGYGSIGSRIIQFLKDDPEIENQYFMEKDMLEAVQTRKVEIGMISLSRLSQVIPLADIFSQPFLIIGCLIPVSYTHLTQPTNREV